MRIELTGKPIVITGASAGIGRATAIACAAAGMPVVVAARREDKLRAVVDEIARAGGRARAVVCDVTSADDSRRLIGAAAAEFGPLYAVFANAGYGFEKPYLSTPDAQLREIFETNFWGSLNVVRPALDAMLGARAGHVLLCSSCLSKIGLPYMWSYTATKAAQDHFGRGLRLELRGTGVYVSTVHPVGTATDLWDVLEKKSEGHAKMALRTPASMMQPASRVADAVVACLRRPRGEVWTSRTARVMLGVATALPRLADWGIGRSLDRDG